MATSDSSASPNPEQPTSFLGDLLSGKTPGVKNIEAAYKRAGATAHHTPGTASKLGSQEDGQIQDQGLGSQSFREEIQEQRQEPSMIGKMANNMLNGTDRAK